MPQTHRRNDTTGNTKSTKLRKKKVLEQQSKKANGYELFFPPKDGKRSRQKSSFVMGQLRIFSHGSGQTAAERKNQHQRGEKKKEQSSGLTKETGPRRSKGNQIRLSGFFQLSSDWSCIRAARCQRTECSLVLLAAPVAIRSSTGLLQLYCCCCSARNHYHSQSFLSFFLSLFLCFVTRLQHPIRN